MLAAVGLVSARRYAALSRRADELSGELQTVKKRATKALARAGDLEGLVQQQKHLLREERTAAKRERSELKTMQARLEETQRTLALAREYLMAIEVKLDILEGAANVLDARTRTLLQR